MRTLVHGARLVVTMDDARTRIPDGAVLIEDDRIERVGRTADLAELPADRRLDARGKVVLPGLVNTHHHLPQVLTRNVPRVQEATLFQWLVELYEVWRGNDAAAVDAAARVGLGELLLTGCTTTSDHLYLFPRGQDRLIDVEIEAAHELGIRFHPTRGSMSRGKSAGGLPPDEVVQDEATILADSRRLIREHHDPRPRAMTRVALAPCSPFSVTDDLMRRTADLAREHGVRLHTHLAETRDEEEYCLKTYGQRPVDYVRRLGWLGDDVWMAHCVHLNDEEVRLFAETGTAVAHCPTSNFRLGSGLAPVRAMLEAGVAVGLGVDGSASNDSSNMLAEVRQALLAPRPALEPSRWPTAEDVLWMATRGGARCLGRDDIGSLEAGKAADLILIDTRRLSYAGAASDLVAALVFTPFPEPVATAIVNGRVVVENGHLVDVDVWELVARADRISEDMLREASRRTGRDYFRKA
ncbi:MAG TPA: 8-oxoguanine deaminase [Vicinamibacteria bacterium]|jgi:8-oxoguanine deaminase|nr:8-oxoguanine deaminase [Vicinamibacteria bacterium]